MIMRIYRKAAASVRRLARSVAGTVETMLPSPTVRPQGEPRPRGEVTRIVVFARLPNPTIDYYLTARLAAPGMPPFRIVDIRDPTVAGLEPDGTFVLICRYASKKVVTWIERHAERLAGVGFFTDDHLGAVITGTEATVGYRLFLLARGVAPLRRLNRHIDMLWVSTRALADSIGVEGIGVLPPAPHPEVWETSRDPTRGGETADDEAIKIVYHATDVHLREHAFLAPIMESVLAQRPNVVFEVTADHRAGRYWKSMDRVTVTGPTSWPEYLERTRREPADIALVPLLYSRANVARAGTKRIDVVRLGAAGIYSRSHAYGDPEDDGEIRLDNRRRLWIATILKLVDDRDLRREAAMASRRLVEAAARSAELGLPGLSLATSDRGATGKPLMPIT